MTVADLRGPEPAACPTRVAVTLNRERFWDLVVDALAGSATPDPCSAVPRRPGPESFRDRGHVGQLAGGDREHPRPTSSLLLCARAR